MSERFVKRVYTNETYADRGNRYALGALIAETVAAYYWVDAFIERRKRPRTFCVIGQRGLAEYAAKKIDAVLRLIERSAAQNNETIGWQFGAAVSLRNTLHEKRESERKDPRYHEQMAASVFRARRELNHSYKVGQSQAKATFDIDGYNRGKAVPWSETSFQSPIQVLDRFAYTLNNPEEINVHEGARP